jgi:signal transduction histidine kinase
MNALVSRSRAEIRAQNAGPDSGLVFPLDQFIAQAKEQALLYAKASGCQFTATPVDAGLNVSGDRGRLFAALENLLQNAFKFTRPNTEVALIVRADDTKIYIDVNDHCGGLAPGYQTRLFKPFTERTNGDRTGLGLGLSFARANVEADAGALEVQDLPAIGCIFTITLPRSS